MNESKKFLKQAIKHPGRCKHMGSEECPEGSPQYNLAKTLKKHHGFHKESAQELAARLLEDEET